MHNHPCLKAAAKQRATKGLEFFNPWKELYEQRRLYSFNSQPMYMAGFVGLNRLMFFTCSFSNKPNNKKVTLYFQRAKLIDSIRLALRSNDTSSLAPLLDDPKLDSFIVANALRSAPSLESALSLTEALKTIPQFRHTQYTIYALAKVLARFQQYRKLKALIDGVNSGKFPNVPRVSFMESIRLYSIAGDIDSVISIWETWKASERGPSAEMYNVLMRHYAHNGKNEEAKKIFNTMINEGVVPNSRTYTVMLEHLVKLEKYDSAMEVFRMLPLMKIKRTVQQYLILLEALVGAEEFKLATILLTDMKIDGKVPGQAMLLSLQRMHKAGFVVETEELVHALLPDERIKNLSYPVQDDQANEDDDDNVKGIVDGDDNVSLVQLKPWLDPSALASALQYWEPDDVSALEDSELVWTSRLVCKMIRSFTVAETAFQFFSWVAHQPGFAHEVHTVTQIICKLAQSGSVDLVDRVLFKIKSENIMLSSTTITMVIDYYGVHKKGQAAMKIFRDSRSLCGPIPEHLKLLLYKSLLRALTKCKMSSHILDIIDEMVLSNILPDIPTFTELMHYFACEGDIKAVQRLFNIVKQSDIKPDTYMYQALIRAFCQCDRAVVALRLFEDMLNSDLAPDTVTKQMLVKNLWKEGKLREAASVEERSEKINGTLPLAPRGRFYAVSSGDIARVCGIYCKNCSIPDSGRE